MALDALRRRSAPRSLEDELDAPGTDLGRSLGTTRVEHGRAAMCPALSRRLARLEHALRRDDRTRRWRGDRPRVGARRRAARPSIRLLAARCGRAGRHRLRVPLRPRPPPAGDRLQRRRSPPGRQLLRPARLRGAARQLRRDRAGKAPAGALVQPRPPADHVRRPARRCCRGAARCSST